MTEAAILNLLNLGMAAVEVGVEREAVLARVTEMQAKGATPEEIAAAIVKMRDDAIAATEQKIG